MRLGVRWGHRTESPSPRSPAPPLASSHLRSCRNLELAGPEWRVTSSLEAARGRPRVSRPRACWAGDSGVGGRGGLREQGGAPGQGFSAPAGWVRRRPPPSRWVAAASGAWAAGRPPPAPPTRLLTQTTNIRLRGGSSERDALRAAHPRRGLRGAPPGMWVPRDCGPGQPLPPFSSPSPLTCPQFDSSQW